MALQPERAYVVVADFPGTVTRAWITGLLVKGLSIPTDVISTEPPRPAKVVRSFSVWLGDLRSAQVIAYDIVEAVLDRGGTVRIDFREPDPTALSVGIEGVWSTIQSTEVVIQGLDVAGALVVVDREEVAALLTWLHKREYPLRHPVVISDDLGAHIAAEGFDVKRLEGVMVLLRAPVTANAEKLTRQILKAGFHPAAIWEY